MRMTPVASQTDAVIQRLQERITALENAVAKLQTAKAAAPVLAEASHTNPEDIDTSVFVHNYGQWFHAHQSHGAPSVSC